VSFEQLQALARKFPPGDAEEVRHLARDSARQRERELLDIAAVAADVSTDSILTLGLEPETSPALLEAFELQYPNVQLESLVGASSKRLEGLAHGVKGKYFEILVRDRLNAGEWVGELGLAHGQTAELSDSATEKGWDLLIRNEDGSAAEYLQLKATRFMAYIKATFEKYPDIRIATTSEIEASAEEILQTDITNAGLDETVEEEIGEMAEGPLTEIAEAVAEFSLDAVPIVPAVVVLVTEGRAVFTGRASIQEALHRGARRVGTAAIFTTLGAAMNALDFGIISVPTTVTLRIAWSRLTNREAMVRFLHQRIEALQLCNVP
jgi:hypothetical protein